MDPADSGAGSRSWFIVSRRQQFLGEAQANLWRIVGLGGFYAIHLLNTRGLRLGFLEFPASETVDERLHAAITALAAAWVVVALAVAVCVRNRVFPALLKYVSTGADIVYLTAALLLVDGPSSPLVVAYFAILCSAALRFDGVLVFYALLGSITGYLFLNGYARWFTDREIGVPRYHQLMVIFALALVGFLLVKIMRRTREVAVEYARRLETSSDETS